MPTDTIGRGPDRRDRRDADRRDRRVSTDLIARVQTDSIARSRPTRSHVETLDHQDDR